ncbi:adenylosuccinate synthetase [Candidatus Uabimicrobium amorphum]|uniref:Adenylosuccinate synthetase n=1 Tax=Uabimicrobium amorphum TaxID=2596890 RepID=A0A5S9ISH1_UABAM|nr:adenylosuccinate synthetase [Candidatus Uabimicrobium amorphum]BBM87289.1 adenylosuccinate synthetase [Candidatus Uabimicrobium amorphum]
MNNKNNYIVVGLGFGDEGKGTITDYLVRKYNVQFVVRYNGGPQAAHNVVTPDNHWHCFSQFGSGTMVPGVKTYLSHFTAINPSFIMEEYKALTNKGYHDALQRLYIDNNCVVITPYHIHMNRFLERVRGNERHGSCGLGVGQAILDSRNPQLPTIYVKDFANVASLKRKLNLLRLMKVDIADQYLAANDCNDETMREYENLKFGYDIEKLIDTYHCFTKSGVHLIDHKSAKDLLKNKLTIYEGAQGVLLDENYGFWPHVTPSTTTTQNAKFLINDLSSNNHKTIGVLRAFATRHGAGPFVSEDDKLSQEIKDVYNKCNLWQGAMRIGWFDMVATCYALKVCPVDELALTNIDRLSGFQEVKICIAYEIARNEISENVVAKFCDYSLEENTFLIKELKVDNFDVSKRQQQNLLLKKCKPVYKNFCGWNDLDKNFEIFRQYIENVLKVKVSILSHGARSDQKFLLL